MYKTEGVVLRTRNLGEADKIVTIFTKTRGKVVASARGARRTRNRLLGSTQVFTLGRYLIFEGKSLDILSQGEIINSFQSLREDLDKMAASMYVCELVDTFVEEAEANPATFALICNTLRTIDSGILKFAIRIFELKFMQQLGYQPQLASCINCGDVKDKVYFSREGGVVCQKCRPEMDYTRSISQGSLALAQRILEWDWSRISILRPTSQSMREIELCMRDYIDYRLDRPMRSLDFIQTLQDFPDSEVKG